MTPDQIFQYSNTLAMLTWLLLIFAPKWKWTSKIVIGISVTLFALIYVLFVFKSIQPSDLQSFSTLEGVMQLFSQKEAVLVGWVHYLAFDLVAGLFIVKNAVKNNINHLLIVPCLLFTFMLGPTGLLIYLLIRLIKTKRYFVDL